MASEVGSGQVPIFPTFKGFRRAVDTEVDSSSKSASSRFSKGFSSAGATAGKGFSSGFKTATAGVTGETLARASAEVAKASREVAAARLKELDISGRVRLAETQLTEARARYAAGSSQVVRAEERLASQERALANVQATVSSATDRLTAAKRSLAAASDQAATAGSRMGGTFARLPGVYNQVGSNVGRRFSQGFLDVLGGALGANILTGIGFTIGRGINQGIGAAFSYGFQGVNFASELEQSVGAITSVFKDQAPIIEGFSRKAAKNVGLSQAAYQKFATVVGAQLKNLKIPFDQVAGKTNDLITLGADLAAQFGGSTSDAVQALSSLLRGERDPVEKFGVSIKQADINARLASQGLKGLTGDALRQAEITATLAILWKQTADAQGTFFAEEDTYAHKQQVLNASLEQTQTRLGEYLLPAFTRISEYANSSLLPRLDSVIDRVGPKLSAAMDTAGPAAERLLDKVAPLVENFLIWGGDEGIPAVIAVMDEMADAAPGWAKALDTVANPNSDFNKWFSDFQTFKPFGDGGLVGLFQREGIFAQVQAAGSSTADEYAEGVKTADGWDRAKDSAGVEVSEIAAMIRRSGGGSFADAGRELGGHFGDGLAGGIQSKTGPVGRAARSLADEAIHQLKVGLDSHSPSKKTQKEGWNAGDGLAGGILDRVAAVRVAGQSLAAAAIVPVSSAAPGSSVGAGRTGADRPIYADGIGLIGWIREVANGEAQLVWAMKDGSDQLTTRMGRSG